MPNNPLSTYGLPPLPPHIANYVAIDRLVERLYVEPRRKSDPLLMTWLHRCHKQGVDFEIIPAELDEIIGRQGYGPHPAKRSDSGDDQAKMENRTAAVDLLAVAADYHASDIHILLRGSFTEVQCRIKGELRILSRLSQAEGEAIVRAFYQGIAVVKDATFQPLQIQNAQISGPVLEGFGLSSVRIIRGPAYPVEDGGGFMILRLQYKDSISAKKENVNLGVLSYPRRPSGQLRLEGLGYLPHQVEKIRYLIEGSSGLVLFTGPTGSGKTTSIYELLMEKARLSPMLRTLSIEKPVEYPMSWAVQLSITDDNERADEGDAFGEYLKHALRMDPDWIFLGEIRSPGVALTAFEAALTGHKVVSTIHAEDPFSVPDRIEIMDAARLPRRMFCNSKMIRGIVTQRLVPQLCHHCSVPLKEANPAYLSPVLAANLKTYGDLSLVRVRGPGCPECHGDGSKDRIAIAEVIVTDTQLMQDFVEHNADVARRNYRARQDADKSVLMTTMDGVLAGRIDPQDVGRYVDAVVPADHLND